MHLLFHCNPKNHRGSPAMIDVLPFGAVINDIFNSVIAPMTTWGRETNLDPCKREKLIEMMTAVHCTAQWSGLALKIFIYTPRQLSLHLVPTIWLPVCRSHVARPWRETVPPACCWFTNHAIRRRYTCFLTFLLGLTFFDAQSHPWQSWCEWYSGRLKSIYVLITPPTV